MKLFCFGAGYSAKAALRRLAPDLEMAWGTTRSADQSSAIADCGAEALVWSGKGMDERIRDRLQAWEASPVTTLIVSANDVDTMRAMAELCL